MKAEREKIHAKVKADTVRLNGSKLELTADEETCTFLLVSDYFVLIAGIILQSIHCHTVAFIIVINCIIKIKNYCFYHL